MAFRLPTHPPQRQQAYTGASQPSSLETRSAAAYAQQPQQQHQQVEESTEWVLFSPSQAGSTTARTLTISTERTPRTAGLSRVSDFGSLETAAQSEDEELDEDVLEDDTTELDSLDDGLHAFREPAGYRMASTQAGPHDSAILPAHDGLGLFAPSSQDVQDQLWHHEQYNPRRRGGGRRRRRSSVRRNWETVEEIQAREIERDRWQRIEQWRMEQSRALLQEIEKETRRRRNSRANHAGERLVSRQALRSDDVRAGVLTGETNAREASTPEAHDTQVLRPQNDDDDAAADESFWRRITRKVIRDLIGIDDSLLSVILGESLVATDKGEQDETSALNGLSNSTLDGLLEPLDMDQVMKGVDDAPQTDDYWHERLLERIARELGILVHQLCEHPGAFSTYVRSSASISKQYAGIPISPAFSDATSSFPRPFPLSRSTSHNTTSNLVSIYSPHYEFGPTLQDAASATHAELFGIEEESPMSPYNPNIQRGSPAAADPSAKSRSGEGFSEAEAARLEREREYWERELDIKMVFHFLRNRFSKNIPFASDDNNNNMTPSSRHRSSATTTLSPYPASQQDPSHRAAIIRQHHPLVARAHARSHQSQVHRAALTRQQARQSSTSVSSSALAEAASPILRHQIRRASSSCASQSAKMSVRSVKRTMAGGSGSSRHYWDIGGSVGSGSVVVSAVGGMGNWGDV
ncbi:hypothetical protein ACJ72_02609 [Emergomyces africanus]|uniref:Uncharacterized protein n=1 Tax=Emergomyces africanus TaxID=1955775 RepID=A0A1B7P2F2_9EURO|nr:hypothetical protein ACJ72_02609 [Emergomyces africanus]